jgi:transaldolase
MSIKEELTKLGESFWLDNINRHIISSMPEFITKGISGLTSNPSIFDKAISQSSDYDDYIQKLKGRPTFEIYDELTVRDIKEAADAFLPIFMETKGSNGYVSIEVNPKLAENVKETVSEAQRLKAKIGLPNILFKVPATPQGFIALTELISQGVNVNMTLIFSQEQYKKVVEGYISGVEKYFKDGGQPDKIFSVASVFVSRVDNLADKIIDEKISQGNAKLSSFKGKAAVANCKLIDAYYRQAFAGERWKKLEKKGFRKQILLFGSTSTKDPSYSDIKYVEELMGKDIINTIPGQTWKAFLDHGKVENTISKGIEESKKIIEDLRNIDIDIQEICDELLLKGLRAFTDSFDHLLDSIEKKSLVLAA